MNSPGGHVTGERRFLDGTKAPRGDVRVLSSGPLAFFSGKSMSSRNETVPQTNTGGQVVFDPGG